MTYEYSGYLTTILDAPDPISVSELDSVVFMPDDLMLWRIEEQEPQREWEHIPVHRTRSKNAVRLEGHFEGIRRLDIATDQPRFWVSLSTLGKKDAQFPVDVTQYPIIEVTYRCASANARPAWLWTYPGGVHFAMLAPGRRWRTVARRIPHFGFPQQVDALTFRLYSTTRTTEALEIESVRFRAMSPREAEASAKDQARLESYEKSHQYPILDEFLPLGTFMNAEAASRLAQTLGLSSEEYWRLVLEDIARHHHNCIALERADVLSAEQLRTVLDLAQSYQVKLVPMYGFRLGSPAKDMREFIDTRVTPYVDVPSVLAWNIYTPLSERKFPDLMKLKPLIENADPNHPVALLTEYPNAFALFARFFTVSGTAHYASHAPWSVADMLQQHVPLSRGQQFWLIAPGSLSPSDTPDWNGCPEMRLMMHLAFANGVKGWFSYIYHSDPPWVSGSCQRSLTGPFLTFSDLWAELGHRMRWFNAIAPLFLQTRPEPRLQKWFGSTSARHARSQLPEHIPATAVYRLRGPDYELYYVVSNDMTEMTTEKINIATRSARGLQFYDLTDFVRDRAWVPMAHTRHLEMSPGQANVILAAKPEACTRCRDAIASRLIQDDQRQLDLGLQLTRSYDIDLAEVEAMADAVGDGDIMTDLGAMKQARNKLLDLIYDTPAICEARSKLIEAGAALCGCDTALCGILAQGKVGRAGELGLKLIPLVRELAHFRLELRRGRGAGIQSHCERLAKRAVQTLAEIRAASSSSSVRNSS